MTLGVPREKEKIEVALKNGPALLTYCVTSTNKIGVTWEISVVFRMTGTTTKSRALIREIEIRVRAEGGLPQ